MVRNFYFLIASSWHNIKSYLLFLFSFSSLSFIILWSSPLRLLFSLPWWLLDLGMNYESERTWERMKWNELEESLGWEWNERKSELREWKGVRKGYSIILHPHNPIFQYLISFLFLLSSFPVSIIFRLLHSFSFSPILSSKKVSLEGN